MLELLFDAGSELGECPVWDDRRGSLWWVDLFLGELHEYRMLDGSHHVHADIGQPLGFVVPFDQSAFAAGTASGVGRLEIGGKFELVSTLEKDRAGFRCNDGKCDHEGHLWAGTMSDTLRSGGCLYKVGAGWETVRVRDDLLVPNGLAWSADSAVMCVADSEKRTVEFWDYDSQKERPVRLVTSVPIPASSGIPDGMTVDSEDCFWLALAGGARVQRYSKTGELLSEIDVPALQPTSCTFGGDHLDQLFITTAKYQMTRAELERWPLSGAIFRMDAGVEGLPPDYYRP